MCRCLRCGDVTHFQHFGIQTRFGFPFPLVCDISIEIIYESNCVVEHGLVLWEAIIPMNEM